MVVGVRVAVARDVMVTVGKALSTACTAANALIRLKDKLFLASVTVMPVSCKKVRSCAGVRLGLACNSSAATPAALGVDCDVPR